jgi:hypothetical protein
MASEHCETSGSQGGENEDESPLGYSAMRIASTIRVMKSDDQPDYGGSTHL